MRLLETIRPGARTKIVGLPGLRDTTSDLS